MSPTFFVGSWQAKAAAITQCHRAQPAPLFQSGAPCLTVTETLQPRGHRRALKTSPKVSSSQGASEVLVDTSEALLEECGPS